MIDRDIDVPLYLYYELTNFHQNHRQYVESKCMDQLVGKEAPLKKQEQECKYKLMNSMNTKRLNPCGLIANSLFNDVFTLTNDNYSVCERDITRPVDRQLFHNPPNYGEEGEYQWIYETYSNIHKDKSEDPNSSAYYGGGIEDEHFIVWMKNSAFPNFRKMYGRIESSMQKNTQLTFTIENNFEVSSYGGTKAIVLSTQNIYSSFTTEMAVIYCVLAVICFAVSIYFIVIGHCYPQYINVPYNKIE